MSYWLKQFGNFRSHSTRSSEVGWAWGDLAAQRCHHGAQFSGPLSSPSSASVSFARALAPLMQTTSVHRKKKPMSFGCLYFETSTAGRLSLTF